MMRLTLLMIGTLAVLCSCNRTAKTQQSMHDKYVQHVDTNKHVRTMAKNATAEPATTKSKQNVVSSTEQVRTVSKSTKQHVDLREFSRQVAAHYAISLRGYGDVAMNRRSMQDFITVVCETNNLPTTVCMKLASDHFDKLAMSLLKVNINEYAQIVMYTCDGQQCISRYKAIMDRKLAKDIKRIQRDFERDKEVQRALQEESAQDD